MKRFKIAAFVMLLVLALTPLAALAGTMEVVREDDVARQAENAVPTNNWVLFTRTAGSLGTFVVGPTAPPLGVGSLRLDTPTSNDKVFLFNYDHIGQALAGIDAISYSTYRFAGTLQQVTALNIQVDFNGPNVEAGFTTLVFEPVYNTAQGAVVDGQWQTWDAYNAGNAKWWSTRAIPGVCAFDCFVTWSTIIANNPEAFILGGFGVNQGSGNPALSAAVDALTLGYGGNSTTYDFEPFHVATDKDQCKDGGWQSLQRADGSFFANQGDCIQYFNTGE